MGDSGGPSGIPDRNEIVVTASIGMRDATVGSVVGKGVNPDCATSSSSSKIAFGTVVEPVVRIFGKSVDLHGSLVEGLVGRSQIDVVEGCSDSLVAFFRGDERLLVLAGDSVALLRGLNTRVEGDTGGVHAVSGG